MYSTHQGTIARYVRDGGPDALASVATFALLTIRVPLERVAKNDAPSILSDERNQLTQAEAASILFGAKALGYTAIWQDKQKHWEHMEAAKRLTSRLHADEIVLYWARAVHGIGYAKAGFIAQLAYGVSGCLDSHNLRRFDIPPRKFETRGRRMPSLQTAARRVVEYNDLVSQAGGTAALWDGWCEYVAERNEWTPEYVSGLHCVALGLPTDDVPF